MHKIMECRIGLAQKSLLPELLAKIFEDCVPDRVHLPTKSHEVPLLLCQICSYWRRVAFATPTLWSAIDIRFCKWPDNSNLVAVARTWLARSGMSTPLSICLHSNYRSRGALMQGGVNLVEDLVIPYIHRFRELHLTLPRSLLESLIRLPACHAKSLEVLDICMHDNFGETSHFLQSGATTVFSSLHQLRSATFESLTIKTSPADPRLLCLPYLHLTDLHYLGIFFELDNCYDLLCQCPNLVHCTLCVTHQGHVVELPPILLPHLQKLKLVFADGSVSGPFLRTLILPALKDFEYGSYRCHYWPDFAFTSLLARSSINLKRFAAPGVHITSLELESLLLNMPSLVELNVVDGLPLSRSTLDRISNGSLIPKLEVIKASVTYLDAVFDMVRSRWKSGDSLTTMRNHNGTMVSRLRDVFFVALDLEDSDHDRVEAFRKEGLVFDASSVW